MQKPIMLPNPVSDREFVAFMRACAADAERPEDLQERLRQKYPAAVVRPRLIEGEQHPMWYIYRDGRWQRQEGGRDEGSDS